MHRVVEPISGAIDAVVRPPGSKSFTNRALVVAALAGGGVSHLSGCLEADDTVAMRNCLRGLGVMVDDNDDPWLVLGTGGLLTAPDEVLDAAASGTTARFVTAIAALADGPVTIDGTPRMRRRPIGPLVDAMEHLGIRVESAGGFPPVTVVPGRRRGGSVTIDGSASSQFVSALLMLAPMLGEPVTIELAGGTAVSRPYLQSTLEVMTAFGADVVDDGPRFVVAPTGYRKTHYAIEADASAAAYPFIAGAVTGGRVVVEGIPATSTQPDLAIIGVLETMGCHVARDHESIILSGPSTLSAVDVDMNDAPDAVLALSVACLFAVGESRIRNVGNLRLKETDRLSALEAEINRIGGRCRIESDDLIITPGDLHGAVVETYDDHRMAMSFAIAGLRVPGIEIADPGCVAKTWPGFFTMLDSL
ncbi:MAG: 3-phosphoshikimate 1-carboxyvinyltransferase [Acidimicrobiia bacterium]|nr:3-phosphoshikimate 1-carboxyvinyltransferase [Acidimicrobiia bacterium]